MRPVLFFTMLLCFPLAHRAQSAWNSEKHQDYTLYYTGDDAADIALYREFLEEGRQVTTKFFNTSFPENFGVYIHPSRESIDSTWQIEWNYPEFSSQCWMVGSGVATRLDLLAPAKWDALSCEHSFSDSTAVKQLITHEMVHVYHGQNNPSGDFSEVSGIDWFVEGLAVYSSGQLTKERLMQVAKGIEEGSIPDHLEDFWTGNLRYGLSGSVVAFIDHRYGRKKLTALLQVQQLDQLLELLQTSETVLLKQWREYITGS